MKRFFLGQLPRLYFAIACLFINVGRLFPFFYRAPNFHPHERSFLAIEAGERGWESIEFKELYQTACEYLSVAEVHRIVITSSESYLFQVEAALKEFQFTHYLYDPRTGRQSFLGGLIDSVRVSVLLARYRVTPIVYLTDLSVRVWRGQAAAVSATNGVVVTFMMPKLVKPIFPHRRLVGPSLMPFSVKTLDCLAGQRSEASELAAPPKNLVRFTGSMYEPRRTFLANLSLELSRTGHVLEVLGRDLGSRRESDAEYWRRLCSATVVITTADQAIQSGTDMVWVPHMVYRYLEVLASGSLLLAPRTPGISRYFLPDKHFASYGSLEEAAEKARFYLDRPHEREVIRLAGHKMASELIRSRLFWITVDSALGPESILV
jgi:hypothetical protein